MMSNQQVHSTVACSDDGALEAVKDHGISGTVKGGETVELAQEVQPYLSNFKRYSHYSFAILSLTIMITVLKMFDINAHKSCLEP